MIRFEAIAATLAQIVAYTDASKSVFLPRPEREQEDGSEISNIVHRTSAINSTTKPKNILIFPIFPEFDTYRGGPLERKKRSVGDTTRPLKTGSGADGKRKVS